MKLILTVQLLAVSFIPSSTLLAQNNSECVASELANIHFKKNNASLTSKAKKKLDSLITIVKNLETCQVFATGYAADMCDKCSVLSWDRTQSVLGYLAKKGVPRDRMVFTTRLDGNSNVVSIALGQLMNLEDTPPHPNLRRN